MENTIKKGDILESSWGYSMTLVQFFMVTKVNPKSVEVVEIGKKDQTGGGYTGTVMPDPSKVATYRVYNENGDGGKHDEPVTGRFLYRGSAWRGKDKSGGHVHFAHLWDGQPVRYNHMD